MAKMDNTSDHRAETASSLTTTRRRSPRFASWSRLVGGCSGIKKVKQDILVTGHIASTLGESLNRLLPVLAIARRLHAAVGLPFLPSYQWQFGKIKFPEELTARPLVGGILDLGLVINRSKLERAVAIGPSEQCWDDGHVAVQLWQAGRHSVSATHFHSPANGSVFAVNLSCAPMNAIGNHDYGALINQLEALRGRYRGARPLVVHVRMDGYSEVSCAHWALARDIEQLIPHIDLLRPRDAAYSDVAIAADVERAARCAYVFFRDPHQVGRALPGRVRVSTADHRGLNSFPHGESALVSAEAAAAAIALALRPWRVEEVYVDVFLTGKELTPADRAHLKAQLHLALQAHGLRPISGWVGLPRDSAGRLPRNGFLGPPMVANLLKLFYARHAAVLVVERGTQWADLIAMQRAAESTDDATRPTYYMHASRAGELRVHRDDARCVRVRGQCVQTDRVPYSVSKGYC